MVEGLNLSNPAAAAAVLKGDLANARVASTPGGIEAQERAGMDGVVAAADRMPKEMYPDRAAFEALGFVFGEDLDDIFVRATYPPGWTLRPSEHAMNSYIHDADGVRRIEFFYKAAFYDRRADAFILKDPLVLEGDLKEIK
jgi:hypothetical protein